MNDASVTGFHHVALTVSDLARSAEFYERLLDLELTIDEHEESRQAKVYRITGTGAVLGLVQHATTADATGEASFRPDRIGLDHVAFAVSDRAAVDRWVERLDGLGIAHSGAIDIPVGAILNFRDPDDIQLSIFWDQG